MELLSELSRGLARAQSVDDLLVLVGECLRSIGLRGFVVALDGDTLVPLADVFEIVHSHHHGHVQAIRTAMTQLGFESLIASRPSRDRDFSSISGLHAPIWTSASCGESRG